MATWKTKEAEEARKYLSGQGICVGDTVLFSADVCTYVGVLALEHGPVAVVRHGDEEHLHTVHYSRLTKLPGQAQSGLA